MMRMDLGSWRYEPEAPSRSESVRSSLVRVGWRLLMREERGLFRLL